MKRFLSLLLIAVLALPAAAAAEQKIRFVDVQRALNESEAGKQAKAEIESVFKDKQDLIDRKVAEKDRFATEFEKQAVVLSEKARIEKSDQLSAMEKEIDRMIADFRQEVQKMQRDMEYHILGELEKVINEIAKQEKVSLVIPADTILYSEDSNDLTDEVIKRYDETRRKDEAKEKEKRGKKK